MNNAGCVKSCFEKWLEYLFNTIFEYLNTYNRDPEQYKCSSIEEDTASLNKLLDWWTRPPYDYYNEWLSETYDALEKADKV